MTQKRTPRLTIKIKRAARDLCKQLSAWHRDAAMMALLSSWEHGGAEIMIKQNDLKYLGVWDAQTARVAVVLEEARATVAVK